MLNPKLLSNEEIRAELQSFGYNIGPVTSNTRNIFIKKLQQLVSIDSNPYTKLRLTTLSSGEDTDESRSAYLNVGTKKKKKSSHYSSSTAGFRQLRSASNTDDPCVASFKVPAIRPARKNVLKKGKYKARDRTVIGGHNVGFHSSLDSSESDEPEVQTELHSLVKFGVPDNRNTYQRRIYHSNEQLYPQSRTSQLVSSLRTVFRPLEFIVTAFKRRSVAANSHTENNGFIPLPRLRNGELQENQTLNNFLTTEERNWFSRNCQAVPKTLLLIVVLFFIGLAVSYVALGRIKTFGSQTGDNFVCVNQWDKYSRNCVEKHRVPTAMLLIKTIYPVLEEKARKHACNSLYDEHLTAHTLTEPDLITYVKTKHIMFSKEDIKNMKIIISSNPHWAITLNANGQEDPLKVTFTLSRIPIACYLKYLLYCFVQRLVQAALCVLIIFIIFKLLSAYKAHAEAYKRNSRVMVARIMKFLRTEFINNGEQPFSIVIDKVHDELIPPQDRKRLAFVWTSAVKHIRHGSPYVKEEKCVINGELKTVWHWAPASGNTASESSSHHSLNSSEESSKLSDDTSPGVSAHQQRTFGGINHRASRIWQGQAFETMAGSPNSVPCSPTPCLKIRHMFDPEAEHGEDWPIFIQDAILEKCEGVSILHLFVDKTSREGCVYVKCQTPEDAGRAYCALHGWWFGNSHLVTVKYLRIERYHERFPEAVNAMAVLQPSNNQRLSMQQ